ncbi:hypothetical protein BDW22DRAFT_1430949 [Trametopsis cervina]|nr:hypothetical protein BDW22DRAFT_1430949 [Trametopsis cervina]
MFFKDGPEYELRKQRPFRPPQIKFSELQAAVPKHLFEKSTAISMQYVVRIVGLSVAFYYGANWLSNWINTHPDPVILGYQVPSLVLKALMWPTYWHFQGLAFGGMWCLSHEAGHGTLSPYNWVNHVLGYVMHTFLLVPYYAWRATHKLHHNAANSVEREENYVPRTRSDYGLPAAEQTQPLRYRELFEDTPIFNFGRIAFMQLFGWQVYLFRNTLGSPMYPPGTNHFSPWSPLFRNEKGWRILLSDIGLLAMTALLVVYGRAVGPAAFLNLYFVPYLLANHWIVMSTFLHHTDPTIPHYRSKEWTWLRGTIATVDRPLLGFWGRFFLLNVSHDHVAHHIFSNIPFYNQPQVTPILRQMLKDDYNYDSTNTFRALYRSFTECCFIEDDGDIVFYKGKDGKAQRQVAADL